METGSSLAEDRGDRRFLLLLAGAALALRVVWVWRSPEAEIFFDKYFFLAQKLAAGGWVTDIPFTSSPLYTYLVGLFHVLLGLQEPGLRLIQALAGAATVIPVWYATRRLGGDLAKKVAGGIVALHPTLVLYDTEPLTFVWENLANALALFFLTRIESGRPRRQIVLAGLALGLSALLRPNVLLWLPVIAVWLWATAARDARLPSRLGRTGLFLAAVGAAIAPVAIMNSVADRGLILVTASGGSTFFGGNNPDANGLTFQPPEGNISLQLQIPKSSLRQPITAEHLAFRMQASWLSGRTLTAREASAFWQGETLAYARRDPKRFLGLLLRKIRFFFHSYESHDISTAFVRGEPLRLPMKAAFVVVWALGLLGLAGCRRRWRTLTPVYGLFFVFLLTTVAFYVNCRLRLPAVLPLAIFGGLFVAGLRARFREKSGSIPLPAAGSFLLLAALFLWPDATVRLVEANDRAFFRYFQPGEQRLARGDLAAAAEYFQGAVRIYPGLAASVLMALEPYPAQPALEAARFAARQAARSAATESEQPGDAYVPVMEEGTRLLIGGSYRAARGKFAQASRLRPAAFQPFALMATCSRMLNDWPGALADQEQAFERGLKFRPDLAQTYLELGQTAIRAREREKAVSYLQRVLFIDPSHPEAGKLLRSLRS